MSETHAHSAAFVRDSMIPEAAPPPGETGALRWMRENLFSSIPNTILTLVSLYLIYTILAAILPWTLQGIWQADSLSECREIRNAAGIESAACWAVINEPLDAADVRLLPDRQPASGQPLLRRRTGRGRRGRGHLRPRCRFHRPDRVRGADESRHR